MKVLLKMKLSGRIKRTVKFLFCSHTFVSNGIVLGSPVVECIHCGILEHEEELIK